MNSACETELIRLTVTGNTQRTFSESGGVFQQNLPPSHLSKHVKKVFDEAAISVLDWPGNSSDLNPIKNLCSILKSRLQKLDYTTKIS